MRYNYISIFTFIFFFSCQGISTQTITVNNASELEDAIESAEPGTKIVMANGTWNDIEIRFYGNGTEQNPITLKAETPGQVIIRGKSDLKLSGEYLVVNGLYFKNGYSPSKAVIEFKINDSVANHSRVTNTVIEGFNKPQRNITDYWVQLFGRHNKFDHNYLAGKSNRGPTLRVDLEGIQNIKNYHKIVNNHFGPRPPKGGPTAETIQIGSSSTSMTPSHTLVANNLFEHCDGEVEIISSKSNFNEFRNNVFYKSEGSLVVRHGNYAIIDGNYFIGDKENEHIGGIRVIGTGHWITNNYFYELHGKGFRSPIAVMNGIPDSPRNRYTQVTDVVVAYNTWINSKSPLQFGIGSNTDKKDVLPPSEIRSEVPIRTIIANNVLYNETGDQHPVVAHDSIDGITFKKNLINNNGADFEAPDGFIRNDFELSSLNEYLFIPTNLPETDPYVGFGFEKISEDLFGNSRANSNSIGAIAHMPDEVPNILDPSKYGPDWFSRESASDSAETLVVSSGKGNLAKKIAEANSGDIVSLEPGTYSIEKPLVIDKEIIIQSKDAENRATIVYSGAAETPAFEMNPKGELYLKGVVLQGTGVQYAFASLKKNMSSLYNLYVSNTEISNFDYILKAYKHSFAEFISFKNSILRNSKNGIELSAEKDDEGNYNAENVIIDNTEFNNIGKNVIDYYRGGYDESTVGGNLVVTNSTFTNSGDQEENNILINTYGIINVDISNNTFKNNGVELVARLWGAKNNTHANNTISNSGKIVVKENLKLNLIY